jgi:hypothetical protein
MKKERQKKVTFLCLVINRTMRRSMIFLLILLWSVASIADIPRPQITKGKGDRCVEDTQFMRKNHMEVILHQRDETVHRGIRTKQHSLKGCVNCHVVKENSVPVTNKSPKHFCSSCHNYAAINIDCFECHASTPGPGVKEE